MAANDDGGRGQNSSGWRFDRTIGMRDLLQLVTMLGMVAALWNNLDKRVALQEQAQVATSHTVEEIKAQTQRIEATVTDLRVNYATTKEMK